MSQSKGEELAGAGEWASEKCMSHWGIFEIFSGDVLSTEEEQCVGGQSEPKEAQQVRLLASGRGACVNSKIKIKNCTGTCQN